ncbi:MAG: hypothetical protein COA78_18290 [Blastopirellula sp.]|nr:MAG: hypothetical protein COA78_18290 [Blastopirellula sp.]
MSTIVNSENSEGSVEPQAEGAAFDRRHDLDALRAFAMLLGIGLHGSLAYITIPLWPVYDTHHSGLFDLFNTLVHGFRMPLFFMISGFFTAMLWRKRGLVSLVKHRAKRILLPLVIFSFTIIPLVIGVLILIGIFGQAGGSINPEQDTLWMAAKNNDIESLKIHLATTEDVNRFDPKTKSTALSWAVMSGSTEAAKLLIEAGADVSLLSSDGSTPLSQAAFFGRAEVVELLLNSGAEVNPVNQYQSTPLDATNADWNIVNWIAGSIDIKVEKDQVTEGHKQVAQLLRKHGGKLNEELKSGVAISSDEIVISEGEDTEAENEQKSKGNKNGGVGFAHLWFLWFLCLLMIPFVFYALLAQLVNWTGPPKFLFLSPAVLLWLIPLTMLPQFYHGLTFPSFGPDTAILIFPPWHILSLYAVFFFFGVFYFDCDDKSGKLGRIWWLTLPVSILIIYPLGMITVYAPQSELLTRWLSTDQIRLASVGLQAMYAWLMTFGLIGLFRTICTKENKTVRYISDSSYWLYVAHMPLIFLAQALVKPLDLPALVKFAIVCVSVTGVLLLSYDLCIRYRWLGTLLNGKRTRVKKMATEEEFVEPLPSVHGD